MKTAHTTLILFFFVSSAALAQTSEELQVLKPVNALFEGMRRGDSAMVHSTFMKDPTFVTVDKGRTGAARLTKDNLQEFINAVGTPHTDIWNEVIWGSEIRIDGNFAQVWTHYAFYVTKNFSHCGVDAFHLFKGADGVWKTFHLADTRQRDKCDVPAEVSSKFK